MCKKVLFIFIVIILGIINFSLAKIVIGKNLDQDFAFGVGFIEPGKAEIMKATGAQWARQPLVFWSFIEPNPPVAGVHNYHWDRLDSIVRDWTAVGFNLQLILKSHSNWATEAVRCIKCRGCGIPDTAPKSGYWNDYAQWIKAVVERYDGDGYNDMPGLTRPVLEYEIESEAQHSVCWEGSTDEYIKMLRRAYRAAKEANPNVQIILSGLNMGDIFDDFPSETLINERIEYAKSQGREDVGFIRQTLQHTDIYDFVEFHWNRDYQGIYETINWIRGYSDKPILAGDAQSGPWIMPTELPFVPLYPQEGELLFRIITDEKDPRHKEVLDWQRREQAKLTFKKVVVGIEAGLQGMNIENINDWGIGLAKTGLGNYMFMGLLDNAGTPKPVYYTYKLAINKLKGYSSVERLKIAGDVVKNKGKGVWAFKFMVQDKPIFVFWYEDNINTCPVCEQNNSASSVVDLSSYISGPKIKITYIITESGQREPKTEIFSAKEMIITKEPVIIE